MMEEYFKKLEDIVFKQKYTIRPIHLVNLFNLHIKQAQFVLEALADKHQKDLIVKYGLIGHQSNLDDEIGARRFVMVERDEVENEKKNFTKFVSCTIKSIKEKHNALDIDYPDECLVTSKEDLVNYQKKGYCINENIEFRGDKLNELLKRLGMSKGTKSSKIITNGNSSKDVKKDVIKVIRPEAKSKDMFASFKNKSKESIKQEMKTESKSDTKSIESSSQSKSNDTDEFVKLKSSKKEDKKSKDGEFSDNDFDDDFEMDVEDEQVKQRIGSSQLKRSKTLDSDSDEDFIHSKENIKHKNKKQRKRVIVFDDSSDEDTKEQMKGPIESKFKPMVKPKEEGSSKLVQEEETYIDEDGFKVTKTVKKIVKDDKEDKKEPIVKKEEKKIELSSPAVEVKKPNVVKAKPTAKNQTSIMSFFKPKNQS